MVAVLLLGGGAAPSYAQEPAPQNAPSPNQFFAGYVTAISENSITVSRTVLGKESSTRTFAITSETRIDGKPKVKSRVTVQFVDAEEGDRAVLIIVRGPQKKQG